MAALPEQDEPQAAPEPRVAEACGAGDDVDAGGEEGPGSKAVKRRPGSFLQNGRRRLTVECGRRLISDLINDETSEDKRADGSCVLRQHPAAALQTPGAVLSVWGSETTETDRFAPYFAQKCINFDGELSGMQHRVGLMSHRGYKPDSPNQDDFFVLAREESVLLGVLDGHGPEGHDVSHFVQERLPTSIMERLRHDGEAWREAVKASIKDLLTEAREETPCKAEYSGSTVSIAMLDRLGGAGSGPLRVRCAFLGDSIAVTARRKSKSHPWEVTQLTDIHRPDREDEAARIGAAGGVVEPGNGYSCARLLTPEWSLAMSRSFGDFSSVPYGLSAEPEFADDMLLEPGYQHMVLVCSDGVWDVIPPDQAVQFVGKFRPEEAQLAVERLVSKAQFRWQETEQVVDDITAILVWPWTGDPQDGD